MVKHTIHSLMSALCFDLICQVIMDYVWRNIPPAHDQSFRRNKADVPLPPQRVNLLGKYSPKIVNLPQFLSCVKIIDKKLLETTTHPWNILKICTWNIMKLDECQWRTARQNVANCGTGEKSLHGSSKRPLLRMSCTSKGEIQHIENK